MSRRPTPDNWNRHPNMNVTNENHPYAAHSQNTVPVIAFNESDHEEDCPVCLEPLSFSFRLPGEKPHIVPECGHALHEACFSAVYGTLPRPGQPRKALGVCGVCRRPMRLGEADTSGHKSNKLALLTGMAERANSGGPSTLYPGRDTPGLRGGGGSNGAGGYNPPPAMKRGPNDDDLIEVFRSGSSMKSGSDPSLNSNATYIVTPSIQATAEFPTITRIQPGGDSQSVFSSQSGSGTTQPLTCIVVIQLPPRRNNVSVPGGSAPAPLDPYSPGSTHSFSPPGNDTLSPPHHHNGNASIMHSNNSAPPPYPQRARSPTASSSHSYSQHTGSHHNATPSISSDFEEKPQDGEEEEESPDSPFHAITEDLRARIIDWKGHSLSGLGPLQMYDHLHVRRDQLLREFYVYLFREAIICVVEEKKSRFPRLLPDSASNTNFSGSNTSKGVLRLKGRIFVRHIKNVTDTSLQGELSLTIDMEDDRLESFILIFKDRGSLDAWKSKVQGLVNAERAKKGFGDNKKSTSSTGGEANEFGNMPPGISGKAARMLSGASGGTMTTNSTASRGDSYLASGTRNTVSSVTSYGSGGYPQQPPQPRRRGSSNALASPGMDMIEENGSYMESQDELNLDTPNSMGGNADVRGMVGYARSPPPSSLHQHHNQQVQQHNSLITPHVTHGPSNNLPSVPHAPLDLLLILSVPPPTAQRSTAQLKLRVMKSTLDFVIASLGPRDRLSIVTFEIGVGGRIRKTPFLRVGGNGDGGLRLAKFIDGMGETFFTSGQGGGDDAYRQMQMQAQAEEDEFLAKTNKNEKTDVVTAVNFGLDVVLQRKQRNPVAGVMLVSDAADSARRAQMDLVLARAEAANVAIHSFGYGRSHDPASLWLISNHTSGTYTFVKEWYDLRDCLAGCLGGMMSVALNNVKLHLKILDAARFKVRKVSGVGNSIVSSDGRHVDVEIGELRYGERKEMLVELDLDNSEDLQKLGVIPPDPNRRNRRTMNGSDLFMQRMGMDALSLSDPSDMMDSFSERMIDEVPVFELDGSYFDPAATKAVSRLAHPVLLLVTLLPISNSRPKTPAPPASDPIIVRRRMELFSSDMITRSLVLISKKQYSQAQKIMFDTRRVLNTTLQNITQGLPPPSAQQGGTVRNRREQLILQTVRTLQSIMQDIQILAEALDENVEGFAFDQRNFGAQQAMILRDQKCWSGRTATERLFFTIDNAIELVTRSTDWVNTRE